jgi:hypothetical protein
MAIWNRIAAWMKVLDGLRRAPEADGGFAGVVGF